MKKQVLYPKFIPRVFAMTIDMVILSIVLTPITITITQYFLIFTFQDYFLTNEINTSDIYVTAVAVNTPEFINQTTPSQRFNFNITRFIINTSIIGITTGAYFIIFWRKLSATPGKIVMLMKIVNADDYSPPSTLQLIKRFIGYPTAFIGIWSILFSKRGLAIHDKIANTVVIKR